MNKIRLYATFAVRNLKGNMMLAILMITAIGVVISASMTTLMLLTAMAPKSDAVAQPSMQLVAANENWGTSKKEWSVETNRICDGKSGWVRLLL